MGETLTQGDVDVPSLVRGRCVTYAGRLASMTHEEFIELVEGNGGQYATTSNLVRVALVVVGQGDSLLTAQGELPPALRHLRVLQRRGSRAVVLPEERFLAGLGLEAYRQNVQRLYTVSTLAEVLGVSRDRVRSWVKAGLIRPGKVEYGVWYFHFRQVAAAKRLVELAGSGVSLGRLRRSLERLRAWLPEAAEPLEQLAVLEGDQRLLVRLEEGELTAPDGQFHFDFSGEPDSSPLRLVQGPQNADEWFQQGVEQEQAGYLDDAIESYRQALLIGGSNPQVSFDLAHALAAAGRNSEAAERYRQAVELKPDYMDAWNNLGVILTELERLDEAVDVFRQALSHNAADRRILYNLADTLEDLGRSTEAAPHWRAYVKEDPRSERGAYARRCLAAR